MKVRLEKTFPLPGPAATAWALLQDIDGVAACMPGAKITERPPVRRRVRAADFENAAVVETHAHDVVMLDPNAPRAQDHHRSDGAMIDTVYDVSCLNFSDRALSDGGRDQRVR